MHTIMFESFVFIESRSKRKYHGIRASMSCEECSLCTMEPSVMIDNIWWLCSRFRNNVSCYSSVHKNATFDQNACPVSRPVTTLGLDPVSKRPFLNNYSFPRSYKLGWCLTESNYLSSSWSLIVSFCARSRRDRR